MYGTVGNRALTRASRCPLQGVSRGNGIRLRIRHRFARQFKNIGVWTKMPFGSAIGKSRRFPAFGGCFERFMAPKGALDKIPQNILMEDRPEVKHKIAVPPPILGKSHTIRSFSTVAVRDSFSARIKANAIARERASRSAGEGSNPKLFATRALTRALFNPKRPAPFPSRT